MGQTLSQQKQPARRAPIEPIGQIQNASHEPVSVGELTARESRANTSPRVHQLQGLRNVLNPRSKGSNQRQDADQRQVLDLPTTPQPGTALVVQRATTGGGAEKEMKKALKEPAEESSALGAPPPEQQPILVEQAAAPANLPAARLAALTQIQAVLGEKDMQLSAAIASLEGRLGELPDHIYFVDEDGEITRSDHAGTIRGLPGAQRLRHRLSVLRTLRSRARGELERLPDLIAAFQPGGGGTRPQIELDKEKTESTIGVIGSVMPTLRGQLEEAEAQVAAARPKNIARKKPSKEQMAAFTEASKKRDELGAKIETLEQRRQTSTVTLTRQEGTIAQAAEAIDLYPALLEEASEALAQVPGEQESFASFRQELLRENKILPQELQNLTTLRDLLELLDGQIATYLRFNGSTGTGTYRAYLALQQEAADERQVLLSLPLERILSGIDANSARVQALVKRQTALEPLLPSRGDIKALKEREAQSMGLQQTEINQVLSQAASAGLSGSGIAALQQQQQQAQKVLRGRMKAIDFTRDPAESIAALGPILDEQERLSEDVAANQDLTAAITGARLARLAGRGGLFVDYAALVDQLLTSGQVLDEATLRRELGRPVEPEKLPSRLMELTHLLEGAQQGAFVQVGRMTTGQLVAALRARSLDATAGTVEAAPPGEFEADGILYFPDGSVEAVQHKTTTSARPLEERIHTSGERTEPEFERQLRDAANQLSGLTAQGSTLAFGRVPEIPPPGATRVANLRFQNVALPDPGALDEYNVVVRRVLGGTQRQDTGPRHPFVQRVVLSFRDGQVIYTALGGGRYQGTVTQRGTEVHRFEIDASGAASSTLNPAASSSPPAEQPKPGGKQEAASSSGTY